MRTRSEVFTAWKAAQLDLSKTDILTAALAKILRYMDKYDVIGKQFAAPGWVIGAIHYRESSFNFGTYLANGDPLFSPDGHPLRTVHVPAGLGPVRNWEDGAVLTLKHQKWNADLKWDLVSALINLEAYNGMGYLRHGQNSPYVWAGTNQYSRGLYVSDGTFDRAKVDPRVGCAALALALRARGINLNEIAVSPAEPGTKVPEQLH